MSGSASKGAMKVKYEAPGKEVCKVFVEGGDVRAVSPENMSTAAPAAAVN